MVASYPTVVRKFADHKDGAEYVLAGHVNAVQDEITAIETILGARPHIKTTASGDVNYGTVAARLASVEQANDSQQGQINTLLNASNTGWNLPIANLYASGTTIPPTASTTHVGRPSDWYKVKWTSVELDTDHIFSPGYFLTIPKSGWWLISSISTTRNPSVNVDITHNLWCRMRVSTTIVPLPYEIAKDDSSAPGGSGGWHRLNTSCGIQLMAGDRVYIEYRHDYIATDPVTITRPSVDISARIQFTYIRALPTAYINSPHVFPLPDDLDPDN